MFLSSRVLGRAGNIGPNSRINIGIVGQGLISKGHPLGATGLAQASELTWQLRGTADKRQVESAALKSAVALQHNIGLGGAVVVTAYRPAER